jgi:hypothetical protein
LFFCIIVDRLLLFVLVFCLLASLSSVVFVFSCLGVALSFLPCVRLVLSCYFSCVVSYCLALSCLVLKLLRDVEAAFANIVATKHQTVFVLSCLVLLFIFFLFTIEVVHFYPSQAEADSHAEPQGFALSCLVLSSWLGLSWLVSSWLVLALSWLGLSCLVLSLILFCLVPSCLALFALSR